MVRGPVERVRNGNRPGQVTRVIAVLFRADVTSFGRRLGENDSSCRLLHRAFALELAPADEGAAHGEDEGLDDHVIHQLPVDESLQEKPAQQLFVFSV
jgi:hypothetical protein